MAFVNNNDDEMPLLKQRGDEFPEGRTGSSGDKRLPPASSILSSTTPSEGHIWSSEVIQAAPSVGSATRKSSVRVWVLAGSAKKLEELLRSGADVQDLNEDNVSALMVACQLGNMQTVKLLHKFKAPFEWTDMHGRSSMHYAAGYGQIDIVGYLIRHGCSCDAADNFGNTPLHEACANGHVAVVEELCRYHANLSRPQHTGWRPIHLACWNGHIDVVKILHKYGVSLKEFKADSSKSTPLHVTCMSSRGYRDFLLAKRRATVVKYLLSQGVDVFAKDAHDRDAALFAAQRQCRTTPSYYRNNPTSGRLEWYTEPCPVQQTLVEESKRRQEVDKAERRRKRAEERAKLASEACELEKAAERVQKVYRNHKAYLRLKQRRALAKLPPLRWHKLEPTGCVMVSDGVRKWQGYHDNHKPEPRIHSTVVACKGTIWIFGGLAFVDDKDEIHKRRAHEREIYEARKARTQRPIEAQYVAQGIPKDKECILLDEMWEWNGGRWCHHNGAAGKRPRARAHHSMTVIGNSSLLTLVGGVASFENEEWLTDIHFFDVVTETWSTPAISGNIPIKLMWHATVNVPSRHSERLHIVGEALSEPKYGEHEPPDGLQTFRIEIPRHQLLVGEKNMPPSLLSNTSYKCKVEANYEYTEAIWSRGGTVTGIVGKNGSRRPPPLEGLTAHKVRHRLAIYGGGAHNDFLHVQIAKDTDKKEIAPRKPYNADEENLKRLSKESFDSLNVSLPSFKPTRENTGKKSKNPRIPVQHTPPWFEPLLTTSDSTVQPPPARHFHASFCLGNYIVIFGGKYDKFQHLDDGFDGDWYSDELIVAKEQPLDRNGRPKFSRISGREEQLWVNIEIEGHVCRAGHGMCLVEKNMYIFGGMSSNTTYHNDLMVLQKVNRSIFSKALSEPPTTLVRLRHLHAKALHAVIHESDTSTTSTEIAWLDRPQEQVMESASIKVQLPNGPKNMVVTKLPTMAKHIGYENCYSYAGQSLREILDRSSAMNSIV